MEIMQQAAIVVPLHRAVFWIHAVWKSCHWPSPNANQVFEHAGMWRPIVQPIVWAHKGGLLQLEVEICGDRARQAYAISGTQCLSQWQRMYCICPARDPQCAPVSSS